jgi:hypothetical protein
MNASRTPPRPSLEGLIPSWAYRHLRLCGAAQLAGGGVGATAGVICLSYGAYGWAALFLVGSALALVCGYWYLTIDPSARART